MKLPRPSLSVRVCVAAIALVAMGSQARLAPRMLASPPLTSIDLSTFVLQGRFDLPEPTRTVPPANSLLAQEASAVTYNWDTDTLFVVGDGGTSVVQVSKTGVLINSMTLGQSGNPATLDFADTEGITYVGGGQFVLVEERIRQVDLFTYVAGGTLHRADVESVKLGTTVGNIGLEGVSYDPLTNGFVLVKEKDPQSIFQTGITFAFGNTGTATNGSPIATASTDLFSPALAGLLDFSDVFALSNLPFLSGQQDFSHLLVISQETGQIINVDRSGIVSSRLTIVKPPLPVNPLSVPDMTMEGITMDRDGTLYVVNENGGGDANHPQLWVYAHSDAVNHAPTGLSLANVVTSMPENTSTAARVKVADVLVADDGLGVNNLQITGPDLASFELVGPMLFLKAGTVLNSGAKPTYSITVSVDDTTVGATPDAHADYSLTIDAPTAGTGSVIISEVAPWSSGSSPAALRADWFELTNVGTAGIPLNGWKMDDDSASFANGVLLTGIANIAPGESVIFIETPDTLDATRAAKKAAFLNTWFGANPPANLQIGFYSGGGVGLGTGGDQVNIFNATGQLQANVVFGASPGGPFPTFDNGVGLNNKTISALSAKGIGGAFVAAGDSAEIGSPGTIGPPVTPVVTIAATDAVASETGPDSGTFRFSRTGSLVGALNVNYTIATGPGKATSADVLPALTNVVTIPAGQLFVDLIVTPVDDALFEGTETLTLTLFDTGSYDVGAPATATVTITDNDPPDTFLDSTPSTPTQSTSATFTFHASDPLSAIAGLECSRDGEAFAACSGSKAYSGLSDGTHTFAVRAIDTAGHIDPTPATFTWILDRVAPVITVAASETVLWPPSGQMVADRITGRVTDPLSGVDPSTVAFRVTDSYGAVQPAGPVVIDSDGRFSFPVALEASRRGQDKDGRRYDITVTASDNAGNRGSATVTVTVPHDRGK